MATTAKGRAPQDHKKPTPTSVELDRQREQDELLADLPELTSPVRLRFRERAVVKEIMALAVGSGVFVEDEDGIEIDVKTEGGRERLSSLFDVVGKIDEFAESIAVDKDAYIEWSRGKEEEHFFAILTHYSSAVGESSGS